MNSSYNKKVSDICLKKIKIYFMYKFFPQKSCPLWDNIEKHGKARQVTHDNIMLLRNMRFALGITKAKIQKQIQNM